MEEKSTIARPYATAVFEQAREENAFERWSGLLDFLSAVVTDRAMAGIIADPRVGRDRLIELLFDICEGRLTDTGRNFLRVLVHARRLALVPEIKRIFDRLRADLEGQSRVQVISPFEMGDRFEEVIAGAMANRLGRVVELAVSIDRSLIGGVVIRAGDLVIDLSLRGRLNQLALSLA